MNRTVAEWNRLTPDEKGEVLEERLENNWTNGSDVRNVMADLDAALARIAELEKDKARALKQYECLRNIASRFLPAVAWRMLDAAMNQTAQQSAEKPLRPCSQFITHHTYTGKGCAMCGCEEMEHAQSEVKPK